MIPEQVDEYYTYDANGNRTSSYLHGTGYRTGTANQLQTDGTYNYAYDDEGNMVKKTEIATGQVTLFEYDHRNRMTRATIWSSDPASGGVILHQESYRYDALGRRIMILADGQVTKTIYNGDNAWADIHAANARYLFGNHIDKLIAQYTPGTGTTWALTDHLGTVRESLGPNGQVISRIAFSAFGNMVSTTSDPSLRQSTFLGREFNTPIQQYNFRTRSYDPRVGRFTTQDGIGFNGLDTNLYRFIRNSPLNGVDSTGETAAWEYSIALGAIGFMLGVFYSQACILTLAVSGHGNSIRLKHFIGPPLAGMFIGMTLPFITRGAVYTSLVGETADAAVLKNVIKSIVGGALTCEVNVALE